MSTIIQRSFASGEIAPALYARVDFFKYQSGLRTCRNLFIMRHGGATNRPGTQFIGEAKDSTKGIRLIPFIFSVDQSYVLEFGESYIRFIDDGEYIKESNQTITGITQADPAVVTTSAAHGYSNGDEVQLATVVGMTEVNVRNFKVNNVTGTTFELQDLGGTDIDSTGYGAYVSGGISQKIYELVTTYTEEELPEIRFVQSSDVLTLAHSDHRPAELKRLAATSWTLTNITTEPDIATPTLGSVTGAPAGSKSIIYTVSAVDEEDFEESYVDQTGMSKVAGEPTEADPAILNWTAVTGAQEYNVYRKINGIYGLIGVAGSITFQDVGVTPDFTQTPQIPRSLFTGSGEYPSAVTYFQQRLMFANSDLNPERVWGSRSGLFKNFSVRSPAQADDSLVFTIAGKQVNQINHMIDIGKLVIFTSAGEWIAGGDDAGALSPTSINLKQQSYYGSNQLAPIVIGNNALFVQARGSIVRDLGFDFQVDGYRGNDLTLFSNHLFDDYSLDDWAYQQSPHSIVWAVRSDGTLLSLTYIKEQQLLAWSRHDFDGGEVENVCVIPEGNRDVLYVTVKRTIDGRSTRYIERMSRRNIFYEREVLGEQVNADIKDVTFMDSHLTYDGRNTIAVNMTLSGGITWEYTEELTLTSAASSFAATDIGNAVHLEDTDGTIVRCEIISYTSATVVKVKPNKTVPTGLRGVATTSWAKAVDEVAGLWHLEGKQVSVFADGFVAANPFNEAYNTVTVSGGKITLDKPYSVIHVGLPYISDIETLDIDTANAETTIDKNKISQEITLLVEESRGIFAGPKPPTDDSVDPLEGLVEFKLRSGEGYDDPIELKTGPVDVNIIPTWNNNGRIFIRQIDPVPLTVLAIAPAGFYPFRGGG